MAHQVHNWAHDVTQRAHSPDTRTAEDRRMDIATTALAGFGLVSLLFCLWAGWI